jgi:hypothetical protein
MREPEGDVPAVLDCFSFAHCPAFEGGLTGELIRVKTLDEQTAWLQPATVEVLANDHLFADFKKIPAGSTARPEAKPRLPNSAPPLFPQGHMIAKSGPGSNTLHHRNWLISFGTLICANQR